MKELLNKMRNIKFQYEALVIKQGTTKGRISREKNWDKMRALRHDFIGLEDKIDWTNVDYSRLCIQSVAGGGPLHLPVGTTVINEGSYLALSIPGQMIPEAGKLELLENNYGIDNLELLIRQFNK